MYAEGRPKLYADFRLHPHPGGVPGSTVITGKKTIKMSKVNTQSLAGLKSVSLLKKVSDLTAL